MGTCIYLNIFAAYKYLYEKTIQVQLKYYSSNYNYLSEKYYYLNLFIAHVAVISYQK